jgi:hypothetical protein
MRRTSLRVSALFLTVLFLATAARDALGLGACPHHYGTPAGALHDSGGAAHAGHAAGAEAHHPAVRGVAGGDASLREGGAPADHGDLCTCIGVCHLTASAPLPGAGVAEWQPVEPVAGNFTTPEAYVALPGPTPYLLPYATAPPCSR